MEAKQMTAHEYMTKHVRHGLSQLFWKHLRRWDDSATFDTFYDMDVLNSQRDYAEEEVQ